MSQILLNTKPFYQNKTEAWAKYKLHSKLMCNIQDDDFSDDFRG